MKRKVLLSVLVMTALLTFVGCGKKKNETPKNNQSNQTTDNSTNTVKGDAKSPTDSIEGEKFILKDHKGYYTAEKDKYIVEGTIVNKTNQTFVNEQITIKAIEDDGNYTYVATCKVEKIGPHGEVKIVAETPNIDPKAKPIVNYQL